MYGQNKKRTEEYRVLLLYGYHSHELFARDVVKELATLNLPQVKVVKYHDPHLPNDNDHRNLPQRRFVKDYLPFDYFVDIHDSPRAVDTEQYSVPACGFIYQSKTKISKRLISQLEDYSQNFQKTVGGRVVEQRFIDYWKDMSSKYDMLSIELMPKYIKKKQAINYLKGLTEILTSNSRLIH